MTLEQRIRQLKDSGYVFVGKGKFSLAYANENHCVKLVSIEDVGHIDYLTSKYLPPFIGRYYPNYINSGTVRDARFLEFYGPRLSKPPERYKGVSWKHYMQCVRDYANNGKYSRLLDDELSIAIDSLAAFCERKGYILDIHANNIMFDGDQLILNDPVVVRKTA